MILDKNESIMILHIDMKYINKKPNTPKIIKIDGGDDNDDDDMI
jgi:hypothetical protein